MMSRSGVNFLVDVLLLASLLAFLFTGGVLLFVFPVPAESAGWFVWGLDYLTWLRLHLALTGWFVLVVLLHVILHWTWVCGFIMARLARRSHPAKALPDGVRTLYGVCVLIALLTLLCSMWALATFSATSPAGAGAR
ncbi:MAG: DUF4405 domain-containing protein [Phycisphaerales bacterium]|nr:DUF4405 domain-containing protein [Phycisphaerales bacterium]